MRLLLLSHDIYDTASLKHLQVLSLSPLPSPVPLPLSFCAIPMESVLLFSTLGKVNRRGLLKVTQHGGILPFEACEPFVFFAAEENYFLPLFLREPLLALINIELS